MGHISEATFADDFAFPWLESHFVDAEIRRQEWLGDDDKPFVDRPTDGYADAFVTPASAGDTTPGIHVAVEIGNDDTVRDECAQAIEYASVSDRAVPYVIIPSHHAEPGVVDAFRNRGVVIIEIRSETAAP